MPPDDRRPAQHRGEPEVAGAGPEACFGEREERTEGQQADAEEQPGLVAPRAQRLDGDRLVVVLARDHEIGGDVEQQAGTAGQRQRREGDSVDDRIDVEVAAEPGADAAEPAAFADADESPRRCLVLCGWVSIVSDM